MRILISTGIFPPDIGGPATFSEKLAKEFWMRGIDTRVICYSDVKKYGNYKFPVIRVSRKYPKIIRHFLYFLKLLKLARNVEAIYIQNPVSAGLPAFLANRILSFIFNHHPKMVLKIVGDYAWEQGKTRMRIQDSIEDFQKKRYSWQIELLRKIQKYVAKRADKIITPSQYLKKIVMGWGVPQEKIEVIYNASEIHFQLDITKKEAKQKIKIEGDIILSIGRLVPWKGFSALIEIMPDLLAENPNFKLVIIGEGPEEKNLKSQISNLKIENQVKLLGRILHNEIPLYLKSADLFVLNTEYEGLSHIILEAMAAGVPVVTTQVGGNPELIENGKNGILVGYNQKEQFKRAILMLWEDKNLQEKFIQSSFQKLKEFTWENLIGKTLKVLKS